MTNRYVPDTEVRFTMPAGKYWIGDLCYVQDDAFRDVYLNLVIDAPGLKPGDIQNGQFEVNGVTFGEFSTLWGDGAYGYEVGGAKIIRDADRSVLGVDSGCIGIVPFAATKGDGLHLGIVVEFYNAFECSSESNAHGRGRARRINKGDLHFGSIVVHTGDQGEDEGEDE